MRWLPLRLRSLLFLASLLYSRWKLSFLLFLHPQLHCFFFLHQSHLRRFTRHWKWKADHRIGSLWTCSDLHFLPIYFLRLHISRLSHQPRHFYKAVLPEVQKLNKFIFQGDLPWSGPSILHLWNKFWNGWSDFRIDDRVRAVSRKQSPSEKTKEVCFDCFSSPKALLMYFHFNYWIN